MTRALLAAGGIAILSAAAFFGMPAREAECGEGCPKQGMACRSDSNCYNRDAWWCVLRCEKSRSDDVGWCKWQGE